MVVSGVSFDAVVLLSVMVVSALAVVDEVSGPSVIWLVSMEAKVVAASFDVIVAEVNCSDSVAGEVVV